MQNTFIISKNIQGVLNQDKKKLNIVSAFSLECGMLGKNLFYKKLNTKKISERCHRDYIELWKEYYNKIRSCIELVNFYGIIQTDSGDIFEISEYIQPKEILENTPIEWEKFYRTYLKILEEINIIIKKYDGQIGMDTSIWNFTVDGKLFDLDPPRIFKDKDSIFSNEKEKGHYNRTFYRNFTEEGMKTNLLATILLGMKKGNIIVKNKSNNYLEQLIMTLIDSFEERESITSKLLGKNTSQLDDFINHPIEIIRKFLKENKEEKMKAEKNQKFIFVTGTSESGKSGAVIHMTKNFPNNVKHLKIRNIFREMYERTNKEMCYEEWYEQQTTTNFDGFWDDYIEVASDLAGDVDIVVMDTLYGVNEMKFLHNRLGKNVGLLYIDAPLQDRISREYTRLRTDSPYSDRKADLTITWKQIEDQTKAKDEKKRKAGAFELKKLAIDENGKLVINDNALVHFATVINNNGTLKEFEDKLDEYIRKELYILKRNKESEQEYETR